MNHLPILPVLVPCAAAIAMLLAGPSGSGCSACSRCCRASRSSRSPHGAAARRRIRRGAGIPARRLARAVRHRAGHRPAVGDDAAAHGGDRAAGRAVRRARLGYPRPALPRPVPVPAHGARRRVRDRRPLQPLRVLRGAADRLLLPGAARPRHGTPARGPALRGAEPRGLGAVPGGHCAALQRGRHAQHGRPRAAAARTARGAGAAGAIRGADPAGGVRPQGGDRAAALVAPGVRTPPPARRSRRCSRS